MVHKEKSSLDNVTLENALRKVFTFYTEILICRWELKSKWSPIAYYLKNKVTITPDDVEVKLKRPYKARWKLGAAPRSSTAPTRSFCAHTYQPRARTILKVYSFKGTIPDNLDESSKLLYSKELGWFSQPQIV